MSYNFPASPKDAYAYPGIQHSQSQSTSLFNDGRLIGVSDLQLGQMDAWPRDQVGGNRNGDERKNILGDEVLEDVSTWSLDTIRQVASSLHQQGVWQADDTPAMASWEEEGASALIPMRSWDSDVPSTSTTHAVISTPTAEFTAQPDINSPQASLQPKTRKKKMYQWEPQQDPQLEKKRLRALKQFRKRQQEEQEERDLKQFLDTTSEEVTNLREEAVVRRQEVAALEQYMARALSLSHQHGQYSTLIVLLNNNM
ncbi:hypothetical protein Pcinc_024692 [Petrolisthes cinctipes]|uniref:Uncharacterized protein n=1 Tax=Petrolisthes cinctipes TaxID=88211 RepID=A0AAE1FAB2_PETCI|nr:hypothetical protein Pcinc_024692 [Petrolisthes cinctipes]